MSGWWAEQFAKFELELSPTITTIAEEFYTSPFSLNLTPSIQIDAVGISTAELTLNLAPNLSFLGSVYVATAALNLDMIVGMDATATSSGSFDLALTPVIGMGGGERYVAEFILTLTPQLGMIAYIKQLPHPIPWTLQENIMAFSLPSDLPTNWADNVGMIENAAYLNAVGAMNNALKAAMIATTNNTAGAVVATAESTTSASYTDLTTTTDTVTVTIGPSGMAIVLLHMTVAATGGTSWMGYAISGANTVAVSDAKALQYQCPASNVGGSFGATFVETGLAAGSTTFKLKYKASGGTPTFSNRRIAVVPFF